MRGESDNTFDNDHMFFDKLSRRAVLRDRPENPCYFFSHSHMRMLLVTTRSGNVRKVLQKGLQ